MTLALFAETNYNPELTEIIGRSWAILGMTGSGKSNSTAKVTEQGLAGGVRASIIDIAGEYWGLKEKFPLVVAGKSPHVDIEIESPEQAAMLAGWSLRERVSVVFDISGYRPKSLRLTMVEAYLSALWDTSLEVRRPYIIVLEEAHNYIPQSGSTIAQDIVTTIATEGRKNGLSLIMVSQRPARIDKDVLSQASIRLLHRVFDPNDVAAYQAVIPESRAWVKDKSMSMETGEAILVYPQRRICQMVHVQARETYHGGDTPGMEEVQPPKLTGMPDETIKALAGLLATAKPKDEAEPPAKSDSIWDWKITDMERQLAEKDSRIKEVESENARLMEENARLRQPAPVSTPAKTKPVESEPYRSKLSTARAVAKQERAFGVMLKDISVASMLHRAMLHYLIDHRASGWFKTNELARAMGYQESTMRSKPPLFLVRYKLLERFINSGKHHYSAQRVEVELAKTYPDLDTDKLIERIQKVCRV